MNHLFLSDAQLTAVEALVRDGLNNLNRQCALTDGVMLNDADRSDLERSMTLLTSVAQTLNEPMHGFWASEQVIKTMSLSDLRERVWAIGKRETTLSEFRRVMAHECNSRFKEMRDGRQCGICDDTSGHCEHRDLELHEFIAAYDRMRDRLRTAA